MDALKRRAQAVLNDKSIDAQSRAIIRYALEPTPGHVPYAEKYGVWQRGLMQFKQPLEQTWKPYLDGQGTRDEAFAELIKLVGESKP